MVSAEGIGEGKKEDATASARRPVDDTTSEREDEAAVLKGRAGGFLEPIYSRGPLLVLAFLALAATYSLTKLPKNVCRCHCVS